MNINLEALQHRVQGNWSCVWKLKLSPKVKNFLWRACRNCLPTRVRLQTKGVRSPNQCVCVKTRLKIIFISSSCVAKVCFDGCFDPYVNFSTNVFAILQHIYQQHKQIFGVTL